MKYLFIGLFAIGLFACESGETTEQAVTTTPTTVPTPALNQLTEAERADGWTLLFDGRSTDQWRGYTKPTFPNQGWKVKEGELIVEHSGTEEDGFGGDIITKETYGDFELVLDFALTDTSNSGIFYLVQEIEDSPIWHHAPEYQLLDDDTYKQIMPIKDSQLSGANYDMHPQTINYSRPIGEWNTARIVKKGNHVQHFLNDKMVVDYHLHDPDWESRYAASKFAEYPTYAAVDEGHLGLQDHGHLCRFRNIKVRRL